MKVHTYEEYEDEFRDKMKAAGLPVEEGVAMSFAKIPKPDELIKIGYAPPQTEWMKTPVDFRPGTWSYSAAAKNLTILDMPNPRNWQPSDARLETAGKLEGDHY